MDDTLTTIQTMAQADMDNVNHVDPVPEGQTVDTFANNAYGAILTAIKTEIETDPEGVGYAGKTNAEIADLLNNSYQKQEGTKQVQTGTAYEIAKDKDGNPLLNQDGTSIVVKVPIMEEQPNIVTKDARVITLLMNIPYAPNAITETLVQEALA